MPACRAQVALQTHLDRMGHLVATAAATSREAAGGDGDGAMPWDAKKQGRHKNIHHI